MLKITERKTLKIEHHEVFFKSDVHPKSSTSLLAIDNC